MTSRMSFPYSKCASKVRQAAKVCRNKILQFLTVDAANIGSEAGLHNGCKTTVAGLLTSNLLLMEHDEYK